MKMAAALIAACLLAGCSSQGSAPNGTYLSFSSDFLNQQEGQSSATCTLYQDKTASLSAHPGVAYRYEEKETGGLLLYCEEETIHIDFQRSSATFYFFYSIDGKALRFAAKDSDYAKKVPASYRPHYEEAAEVVFSGPGITSGIKTTGTISLLNDVAKTVYYAPTGLEEAETKYLQIGKGWSFVDNAYFFSLDGETYTSSFSEGAYHLTINDIAYSAKR